MFQLTPKGLAAIQDMAVPDEVIFLEITKEQLEIINDALKAEQEKQATENRDQLIYDLHLQASEQ